MLRLSEYIDRNRERILDAWLHETERVAASRGLSEPEIRNVLPTYLAALGSGADAAEALRKPVANHLAGRLRQGFDLAEMVEEFVALERILQEQWLSLPPEKRPVEKDRIALSLSIQRTVVVVTEIFNEHMQLDEQQEKRYLRLLQNIADQALRTPDRPLASRLGEVVKVILEGTGAHSASLLLYEHDNQHLHTVASAGVGADALEELATSLAPSSFGGTIAGQAEPTELADIETTELEVSDTLRHSGIHAVLGIRLPPRFRLLGILYIGLRERRPFTRRELRRLEALADRLTLLLYNAELYAELRRRVEELAAERELRERFVAVLAHDLRGPLGAAKLGAELLEEHPEHPGQRREAAERIVRSLDRLDGMIRDLLDVSRVRAGERLPLHLGEHDLVQIARDVVRDLSLAHGDRIDVVAEREVRGIWSAEELSRAIWNLCSNALKYGAERGRVTVRVERVSDRACLSVHNTGTPIPPSDQPRLFDVYERLRARSRPGGWGLGLTLVRACADAHGGDISVESSEESGTTFTLLLPLDSRAAAGLAPP